MATLLVGLVALSSGCTSATTSVEGPLVFNEAGARPAPYAQEVHADGPLAHWRLSGPAKGAVEGDGDGAIDFKKGDSLVLEGADIGGPAVAFELWLKDAKGTALTCTGPAGERVFELENTRTLAVSFFGERFDTGIELTQGQWQHVGVSWRSSDGLMMVVVDGRLKTRLKASKGRLLPFGAGLVVGGDFVGGLDEVVAFNKTRHASDWLHRTHVARGKAQPSKPDDGLPLRLVVQSGHTGAIKSVSWSPDGTRLLTTSDDKRAKIWDSTTGALLHELTGHAASVGSASWSPDGTRILTGHQTTKIWDSQTGALLHETRDQRKGVRLRAWSPDGTRFATLHPDKKANVWSSATGTLLHAPEEIGSVNSIMWSPDGSRLATIQSDERAVIREGATGALLHKLKGHTVDQSISWSPDGARLATASADKTMRVWDRDGALLYEIKAHAGPIHLVAWSPDGSKLATSSFYDKTTRVWDSANGALLRELKGHDDWIVSVSWSPDGARLGALSKGNALKVWDSATDALLLPLEGYNSAVRSVLWSPDGSKLGVRCWDNTVKVWDSAAATLLYDIKAHSKPVNSISWSPDGARLATGSDDNTAMLWDSATGALLHELKGHTDPARSVSWSPDGTRILTGSDDKRARVWDSATGALLHEIQDDASPTSMLVSWSPDGTKFATAHKTTKIWESTGALLHELNGHTDAVVSIAWSPDGTRLATGNKDVSRMTARGMDGTTQVWDTATGALLHELKGHGGEVLSLSWSPDGAKLATANYGTASIWDSTTGAPIRSLHGHAKGTVRSVAWSPDGSRLATSGDDNTAMIWDSASGALLHELKDHSAAVVSVSWSPDGAMLATGSKDNTARIWDGADGALVHSLKGHTSSINSVSWSPDGVKLAVASDDGTTKIWDTATGAQITFIGSDEGAWLSFNDRGYFDGSAKANGLLAVVQGSRTFAFDQLAPTRNRPDKVLESLGAPKMLIDFNKLLWLRRLGRLGLSPDDLSEDFSSAPTARILQHTAPDQKGEVGVSLLFTDQAGLKGYRLFVNGVPLSQRPQALKGRRQALTLPIQLTAGTNKIEVAALNTQGIESLRATTTIEHQGEGLPEPKLYFVGFGVSDYADDRLDLRFAHQDVLDLEAALSARKGDFAGVHTMTFTDAQVTEGALEEARAFLQQITAHDTLVMFIAGHGVRGADQARSYYYLDHDAQLSDLEGTAIPFEEMEALLYGSKARKKLFLLDTCESGEDIDLGTLTAELPGVVDLKARSVRGFKKLDAITLGEGDRQAERRSEGLAQMWLNALRDKDRLIMQDLARRSGAIVLASSLGQESSLETGTWANGAFTEEILRALQSGVADTNKDGKVSVDELARHVSAAVPELTGERQHPNVERDNPLQHFALPTSSP